jgi:hypothetical protein
MGAHLFPRWRSPYASVEEPILVVSALELTLLLRWTGSQNGSLTLAFPLRQSVENAGVGRTRALEKEPEWAPILALASTLALPQPELSGLTIDISV